VILAITNIKGLNQEYPSFPQYKVSEMAAPVDTVAIPNITNTTEGRQHIEAITDELATSFQRDRELFCSIDSGDSTSCMESIYSFSTKILVLFKH